MTPADLAAAINRALASADLATAIERALQSDKSALIVMAELRPLLPEVVRVLRERQEESK